MKFVNALIIATITVVIVSGCKDPIGSPCEMKGSGFHASDNCRYRCLQHRTIVCPDGTEFAPKTCSGKRQCEPGECGKGQVCYHVADPFNKESYCIENTLCGTLSPDELSQWERDSLQISNEKRKIWEEKKKRMKSVTKPVDQ